jgi:DNA-binding response OmpR family regulator
MINNDNKKRILYVDDEPDITYSFKIGLEDNGFVVDTFKDPELASSNFKCDLYDLLLLDIKMPKLNGIDFYCHMKKMDNKVKVCFITASEIYYFERITKEIFAQLGTRRLFRKPIKLDDLVKALKKELGLIYSNNNSNLKN